MRLQDTVTQHDKIIELCRDGDWKCQSLFWLISKSPHKRRGDLEKRGYQFEERTCAHGIRNSKDFRLASVPKPTETRQQHVEFLPDGSVRVTYA